MNLHDLLLDLAAGTQPADARVVRNALWARVGSAMRLRSPTRSLTVPTPQTDAHLLAEESVIHRDGTGREIPDPVDLRSGRGGGGEARQAQR